MEGEILALINDGNAWPADFPDPATNEEIDAAERELQVVFPPSYRAFLRHFGAGNLYSHEFYGLPSDSLRGNVVTMNQLSPRQRPLRYLRFTEVIAGSAYFLDTARANSDGECPVVARTADDRETWVADSFLQFLRKASTGVL